MILQQLFDDAARVAATQRGRTLRRDPAMIRLVDTPPPDVLGVHGAMRSVMGWIERIPDQLRRGGASVDGAGHLHLCQTTHGGRTLTAVQRTAIEPTAYGESERDALAL